MSDGVHLLIPFAASATMGGREAMRQLELPQLQRLLNRLASSASDPGDEHSMSPPHERVLAAACALSAPDGCIPWAAWQVQQSGRNPDSAAWAWITPCHWQVATDHILMKHPHDLQLEVRESKALLAAMQPFMAHDGITLEYHAPTRWLAHGEMFRGLATASLDRVMNRDIHEWVPRAAPARALRRLQQEIQMLLYTTPENEQRAQSGLLPVNSFWASGTGALPAHANPAATASLQLNYALRDAALLEDWPAWAAAWQQIDSQQGRQLNADLDRGQSVTLTLCGEANARSWSGRDTGFWHRARRVFGREPLPKLFETL